MGNHECYIVMEYSAEEHPYPVRAFLSYLEAQEHVEALGSGPAYYYVVLTIPLSV